MQKKNVRYPRAKESPQKHLNAGLTWVGLSVREYFGTDGTGPTILQYVAAVAKHDAGLRSRFARLAAHTHGTTGIHARSKEAVDVKAVLDGRGVGVGPLGAAEEESTGGYCR